MGTYKINPQSLIGNVAGFGIENLFSYTVDSSDSDYLTTLRNGGEYDDVEFRLSKKAHHYPPHGVAIADRFMELKNGDDIYIIEAPIIRTNRTKIINRTHIIGHKGTIKEFVAFSDYEIKVTFYVYGKNRMQLDYDDLGNFFEIFNLTTEIDINSPLLNNLYGVNKVVLDKIDNISEHETYKNVMVVDMIMYSDDVYEPFTKIINQNA